VTILLISTKWSAATMKKTISECNVERLRNRQPRRKLIPNAAVKNFAVFLFAHAAPLLEEGWD